MPTPDNPSFRPRQVAALLGLTVPTLRYWERAFRQLNPLRTTRGQR